MSANAASIVAAIGASGSGKSAWIKQQLAERPPSRLLVWDPQGEYGKFGRVFTDRVKLIGYVRAAPEFAAVYQPGDRLSEYAARFDWLCRLAYALGDLVLVVEELADVTTASWAPDSWSVVTRKGRHKALRIVAASQRPAKVDKDFFGNCTLIHCGRLNFRPDLVTMAGVLGVEVERLGALPELAYVERNMASGATREGTLKLRKPAARPARNVGPT